MLSSSIDASSVHDASVILVGAGPDATFDTLDDVPIVPAGISVAAGNEIHLDLTGIPLANDTYRITLRGNTPINTGQVAWWRLDETSGAVVGDSSGNGNHGTLGGNPLWQPAGGRIGGALSFDGVDDLVMVPRSSSLEPTSAITVCLWAKVSSPTSSFADLLRKAGSQSPGYLLRWYQFDDRYWFRLDRSGNPQIFIPDTQTTAPYLNGWHHFAGTYDSATGIAGLYVDGVLRNSFTGQTGPLEHTDNLYLMFTPDPLQQPVPGLLDDVRIYSRALSLSEIQTLAAGASDAAVTDLAGAPVDGESAGTLPSGNGVPGGDFVSTFILNTTLPPAPSLLIAQPALTGEIDLTWTDNSTNELGFRIERSPDGLAFVEIATVGPDVTVYRDGAPLSPSFYRVRAYNAGGPGGYTNVAAATPAGGLTAGGCGMIGLEILLPMAALFLVRRRAGFTV